MTQSWQIDGPRVLDIGDEHERVTKLVIGVVGGRVDVVTHDDSPTARVEVADIEGLPLEVSWNGGTLKLTHGKHPDKNVMEMLKRTIEGIGRNKVRLSVSVPVDTRATVSTVSADAVVSGVRNRVKVNTVSGALTVSDIVGAIDLNTVSGSVEGEDLHGPLTANTVSGSITLQGSTFDSVKGNTVSGDITLDLLDGHTVVASNSVSGDITVRAPLTGFDVEGNTATGHVVVDGRTLPRAGKTSHGERGGRLREGDGSLRLKANAVSGNVVVLRAGSGAGIPQDAAPGAWPGATPSAPQDAPAPFAPPSQQTPQDAPAPPWGEDEERA